MQHFRPCKHFEKIKILILFSTKYDDVNISRFERNLLRRLVRTTQIREADLLVYRLAVARRLLRS